ncbi:MAG: A/G-specific adenine glycosylase [Lachnospiraceae bacterium]|nr:A/G-specific adenine glycosylase [Lachnospiraceae bacterium]
MHSPEIAEKLLAWYDKGRRILPWRESRDPYHIWVSEIMLQQTRVEAVKPYYDRFLKALPTIQDLAEADEELLLKLWEGLGYYNRVRNLQKAARVMMEQHQGQMPADYDALLALPGIGSYTAGAVASIAFGIPAPAVDGNVMRVFARLDADAEDILLPAHKRRIEAELAELMPADRPGDMNQSLMELGAMVCLPNGAPKCESCPLQDLCKARAAGNMTDYPVKKPKAKRKIENMTVFVIESENRLVIRKRPNKGLLAGLYELPHAEGFLDETGAVEYVRSLGVEPLQVKALPEAKHIFTHKEWHMKGFSVKIDEIRLADALENGRLTAEFLIAKEEIEKKYPIPSAFDAFMRKEKERKAIFTK